MRVQRGLGILFGNLAALLQRGGVNSDFRNGDCTDWRQVNIRGHHRCHTVFADGCPDGPQERSSKIWFALVQAINDHDYPMAQARCIPHQGTRRRRAQECDFSVQRWS